MADINVPEEVNLPAPLTDREKDVFNELQEHSRLVSQSFSALEGIESVTAGDGLTDTANTFSVNVDDSTIETSGGSLQVKNLGIDTAQLAADAVDGTKVSDNAIDTEHLAADAVDGTKIADNSIDSEHIAAGAIDNEHFSDNCVDGTNIALGSDAQGDVMYYDGTNWVRLGAGTSGQVLQTQGTGANPIWASSGGGSGALFSFGNGDQYQQNSHGLSSAPTYDIPSTDNRPAWVNNAETFKTVISSKFKKESGIDDVDFYAYMYNSSIENDEVVECRVTIGSQSGTATSNQGSGAEEWINSTIDISSLSDGTVYNLYVAIRTYDPDGGWSGSEPAILYHVVGFKA